MELQEHYHRLNPGHIVVDLIELRQLVNELDARLERDYPERLPLNLDAVVARFTEHYPEYPLPVVIRCAQWRMMIWNQPAVNKHIEALYKAEEEKKRLTKRKRKVSLSTVTKKEIANLWKPKASRP